MRNVSKTEKRIKIIFDVIFIVAFISVLIFFAVYNVNDINEDNIVEFSFRMTDELNDETDRRYIEDYIVPEFNAKIKNPLNKQKYNSEFYSTENIYIYIRYNKVTRKISSKVIAKPNFFAEMPVNNNNDIMPDILLSKNSTQLTKKEVENINASLVTPVKTEFIKKHLYYYTLYETKLIDNNKEIYSRKYAKEFFDMQLN